MSVKSEIIKVLEENREQAISGQELADMLHVTRAAVWKAVKALKKEGYAIHAAQNRGYSLAGESDILSEEGIRLFLKGDQKSNRIVVKKSVDSTNVFAKKLAIEGVAHGTIVAAEMQTKGRGRNGKSFFSPEGTGIYMSLILRPRGKLAEILPITAATAVGIVRVIRRMTGMETKIKWVNDIYLENRKICGILTEAIMDFESGGIDALIIGIGLNIRTEQEAFPVELRDTAASLFPEKVTRNELIAEIAEEVLELSEAPGTMEIMEEYRQYSLVLGKEIFWEEKGIERSGIAKEITADGALKVLCGSEEVLLRAGVISVRSCLWNRK